MTIGRSIVWTRPAASHGSAGRSRGFIEPAMAAMIASVLAAIGLLAALIGMGSWSSHKPTLSLDCAAVFHPAMELIVDDYLREHGVSVVVQYGGSGVLLGSLEIGQAADLYLPADESFLASARSSGLLDDSTPILTLTPVLAVRADNPKSIRSLDDLTRTDLRVGLADPDAAAIGAISRRALVDLGLWDRVGANVMVFKATVSEIATDLDIGAIDATILWRQTASSIASIEAVPGDALSTYRSPVSIAVLAESSHEQEALRFARFVAGPGLARFAQMGYSPSQKGGS